MFYPNSALLRLQLPGNAMGLIEHIHHDGAVVIQNALNEHQCHEFLQEAALHSFSHVIPSDKHHRVIEEAEITNVLPHSTFRLLQMATQAQLWQLFANHDGIFSPDLNLNASTLYRYPRGSSGISSHRDSAKYINLVCIFSLSGKALFTTRMYRHGKIMLRGTLLPGDLCIMRAPGFRGANIRPFHAATDIEGPRLTFQLRQE